MAPSRTPVERFSALETMMKIIGTTLLIFVPLVSAWGAYITINVISMKQALIDKDTKLVAQLKNPESKQQLQANLAVVDAQIQTARLEGKKPDIRKLDLLALSLSSVIQKNPDLPQAWQTAAQLVSYRETGGNSRAACGEPELKLHLVGDHFSPNMPTIPEFAYKNCTLDLENILTFDSGKTWPYPESVVVTLENVHVLYQGGNIPHVATILLKNCTFDMNINSTPTPKGRNLTQGLLTAANPKDVKIELSPKG